MGSTYWPLPVTYALFIVGKYIFNAVSVANDGSIEVIGWIGQWYTLVGVVCLYLLLEISHPFIEEKLREA